MAVVAAANGSVRVLLRAGRARRVDRALGPIDFFLGGFGTRGGENQRTDATARRRIARKYSRDGVR